MADIQLVSMCVVIAGLLLAMLWLSAATWYIKQTGRIRRGEPEQAKPAWVRLSDRLSDPRGRQDG